MTRNRIIGTPKLAAALNDSVDIEIVPIEEPNPGTPDDQVSRFRMDGRLAARFGPILRDGLPGGLQPPEIGEPGRVDWWLGWYDEQLRRFYGR
jgi:hypothetical protein